MFREDNIDVQRGEYRCLDRIIQMFREDNIYMYREENIDVQRG